MLQQQSSGGGGEHPQCRQCVKHNGSAPPEDPVWSLNPSCSFSSANTCFLIEGRLLNVGSRWLRSESIPRFGSQLVARQRASAGLTDLGYSWSLTPQLRLLALLLLPSPLRQTTFGPTIENDADASGRDGGGNSVPAADIEVEAGVGDVGDVIDFSRRLLDDGRGLLAANNGRCHLRTWTIHVGGAAGWQTFNLQLNSSLQHFKLNQPI